MRGFACACKGIFPDVVQPAHNMCTDPRHENPENNSAPFDENYYKLLTDSPDEIRDI